jgi:hypothetical protein
MSAVCAAAQGDDRALPSRPIVGVVPLVNDTVTARQLLGQVEQWTRDYASWKAWQEQWRNTPEPGWFSAKSRRQAPVPPDWLGPLCARSAQDDEPIASACSAWRDWSNSDMAVDALSQQFAQSRISHEAPHRTQWWERVHLDAYWPMTRSGTSAFGVVGMHATMQIAKRVQVFMAPGIILMRVPTLDGHQSWSAATDWGFSYRLFDFQMPVLHRGTSAHLNMAKVWMLGNNADLASIGNDMYVAGFSLTFRKK